MTRTLRLVVAVCAVLLGSWTVASGAERERVSPRKISASPSRATTVADSLQRSRADLIAAVRAYHTALERVLALQEQDVRQASDELSKLRELKERGLIAEREVDEAEERLAAAARKVDETRSEFAQSEALVAEMLPPDAGGRDAGLAEETVTLPWSIAEVGKIERFFSARFGRALPVSALGQTAVHDRMGFDHRNAVDVAVHPDSEEGQALIAYLRRQGVPFIGFRGPVRRAATGAHIHIGEESKRIVAHAPTRVKRAAKRGDRAPVTTAAGVKRRVRR